MFDYKRNRLLCSPVEDYDIGPSFLHEDIGIINQCHSNSPVLIVPSTMLEDPSRIALVAYKDFYEKDSYSFEGTVEWSVSYLSNDKELIVSEDKYDRVVCFSNEDLLNFIRLQDTCTLAISYHKGQSGTIRSSNGIYFSYPSKFFYENGVVFLQEGLQYRFYQRTVYYNESWAANFRTDTISYQ